MGKKVYHVFRNYDEYLATFTSSEKAREFATDKFYNQLGCLDLLVSVYDLETHEHLDIWYSSFLEQENKEKK